MSIDKIVLAIIAGSSLLLAACSDDSTTPTEQDIVVKFSAVVADDAFTCGNTYSNIGIGLNEWEVSDFRFYVHDVHLHDESSGNHYELELKQDGVWQYQNVALIDLEDGCGAGNVEMNDQVEGTISVPAGNSLAASKLKACFVLGVPEALNHLDPASAPSPLNSSGMLWAWKTGMKYLRIDGSGDPNGTPVGYNLHLGAQGCPDGSGTAPPVSSCSIPNTVEICIEDFDIENDRIAVDPAAVLVASDVSNNYSGAPGCQSFANDQDCISVMPKLGLDFTYDDGAGNSVAVGAETQKLFRKQ